MNEYKAVHVLMLGSLLKDDPRSEVLKTIYYRYGRQEFVLIRYKSGMRVWINVTMDSLGAIHQEIVREVYGGKHAVGRIFGEGQIKRLEQIFLKEVEDDRS